MFLYSIFRLILYWYIFTIALPNSTKPTPVPIEKDLAVAGGNSVSSGAAAAPSTASPSHSSSPDNVILMLT